MTSSPPSLKTSIAANIDRLEQAIVVPPPKGGANHSTQKSGVLTADGRFVENSATWRKNYRINSEPEMPSTNEIKDLPGRHMFAGLLFGHFGHFLTESICRFWAVERLKGKIDGIVFIPKFQHRSQIMLSKYTPLVRRLGVDLPLQVLEDPTRVETLYVPQQGLGLFELIEGAPEFRDYVRSLPVKQMKSEGAEKIYISRSQLPPSRGGILGEKQIEMHLEAEGYTIYHPQQHNLEAQINTYRAARKIISVDASPLHLLALVGDPHQKLACIARRDGNLDEVFARQFKAFEGAETTTINAITQNWIPEIHNNPSRLSFGEVDLSVVYEQLKEAGFIHGTTPWQHFNKDELAALLSELAKNQEVAFKPYRQEQL